MKKFLMALAVTTMAVSPMVTAQAQAVQHRVVEKKISNNNGKRVVKKTVTQRNGQRFVTKTTTRNNIQRDRYNGQRYSAVQQRHWAKGQRFDRRYATNYRVINNPRAYRLSNAPRGHQWVRSGNDAVLIAITSGIIGAVIGNAIR
ncbi:RcnB family protein [Parasphingorhabdus sp.]|uniref:RcnB family protein n=1 Tax=Parasphingorhabdus sp. TaxID=2709688 RepID=UPI003001A5FD